MYSSDRVPDTMTQNKQTYHLLYNHQGSLRAVVDRDGTIVKEIQYDSFGIITQDTNPALHVSFGFAGGLYDPDTKLTRFGYRDYDAQTGKWTAKDPIGFGGGDSNLYGYVLGDPANGVDPLGLKVFNCKQSGVGGHHWNCIDVNGIKECDSLYPSQSIKFPDIYLPHKGKPAFKDKYDSKSCTEVDDDKDNCIERCLLKIWGQSRPNYALGWLGSDCQEYTADTLSNCFKECKK